LLLYFSSPKISFQNLVFQVLILFWLTLHQTNIFFLSWLFSHFLSLLLGRTISFLFLFLFFYWWSLLYYLLCKNISACTKSLFFFFFFFACLSLDVESQFSCWTLLYLHFFFNSLDVIWSSTWSWNNFSLSWVDLSLKRNSKLNIW